ncbi:MAG: hypothetical protein DRP22_00935 [Verrucomicrobia bacterium]|nr:MAG: hypothetical protein DRP22_00935 [Verrucomicrobiota bacterium]
MRGKTVLILLAVALLLAAYIGFYERKTLSSREKLERAGKAFLIDPERVSRLVISNEYVDVECVKEDERWRLVRPVKARADQAEIQRILYDLEAVEYTARIGMHELEQEGLTLADYGLDKPRALITYKEDDRSVTICIGKDAVLGDSVYAMVKGSETVLSVGSAVFTGLPKDVQQLRDHDIFFFKRHEICELGLRRPAGYVRLTSIGADHWRLSQPVKARANRVRVGKLLDQLYATRIAKFVADAVQDATLYGLEEGSYGVEVYLSGKPEPEVLLLGKVADKDSARMYAMWKSERSVYLVPTGIVAEIAVPLKELRDWRLVPIKDFEIAEVRLESSEKTVVLQKENYRWKVREPVNVDADEEAVRSLLRQWTAAEIEEFISSPDTNMAVYGLDEPVADIVFKPAPDAFSWTNEVALSFGRKVPGKKDQRYVACRGENEIWIVDAGILDKTTFDFLHYRSRQVMDVPSFTVRKMVLVREGETQAVDRADSSAPFRAETEGREARSDDDLKHLLDQVAQLQAEELVEASPDNLARYGLDDPRIKLTLEVTPDSGVGKTLLLGDATPEGGAFAMVAGSDLVFRIGADLAAELSRGLLKPAQSE